MTRLRALLRGCEWMLSAFPDVADRAGLPVPVIPTYVAAQQPVIFRAIVRFLGRVADGRGLVLALDDLHWTGPDAFDLLAAVAHSAHEIPARLLLAYRSTEESVTPELTRLVTDMVAADIAHVLELEPLPYSDSAALVEHVLGGEVTERSDEIVAQCGGNPFFLVSLSRAHSLPGRRMSSIGQAIRQRVGSLPAQVREVLSVIAVAGRPVELEVLLGVTGTSMSRLAESLAASCAARILLEDGNRYSFAHDLIREAIEGDLMEPDRRDLHRKLADVLGHMRDPYGRLAAEIAGHAARAGDRARACRYELRAGEVARDACAQDGAELHFFRAATLAHDEGDLMAEARAEEGLGRVYQTVARYAEGIEHLERARRLYCRAGDRPAEATALAMLAAQYWLHKAPGVALARVSDLLHSMEGDPPSAGMAELNIILTLLWFPDRPHDALAAGERAINIARTLGDERLLAHAEARTGLALGRVGRWEDGGCLLEASIQRSRDVGDLQTLHFALSFLAVTRQVQGMVRQARELFHEAALVAERWGDPTFIAYHLRNVGMMTFYLGDWTQARAFFEQAARADTRNSTFSALIPAQMVELSVAEGRWEDVQTYAAETAVLDNGQRNDRVDTSLLCSLAEADLLLGDATGAYERIRSRLHGFYDDERVNFRISPTAIEVCVTIGDMACAESLQSAYETVIADQRNRFREVPALRSRGMVLAAQGRSTEAVDALACSVERADVMCWPLEKARALEAWGRVLQATGDPDGGGDKLDEALRIYRELGARPFVARAEGARARLAESTGRRG